jgi:hypothetical protein
MDTIEISDTQTVYGGATDINWDGTTGTTMFNVVSGGSLLCSGLVIDGDGVTNAFTVAGALTLRDNTGISDCGTAINITSGGNVILNRSSIGGTTSVQMADSTSSCTLCAGSGQTIYLGAVVLNGGAYLTASSALTDAFTVTCATPSAGLDVVKGSGYTLTSTDLSYCTCTNTGYHVVLNTGANVLELAAN